MKKKVMVVFLMGLFLTSAYTQVSLGAKSALTAYRYVGSDWEEFLKSNDIKNEGSFSYSFGIFLEIPISRQFEIQPEIKYSSARHQYSDISQTEAEIWTYLNIPFYLKYNGYLEGGKLYAMAGPAVLYLFDNIELEYNGTNYFYKADNEVLFGIAVAAGYEMDIGYGTLVLGIVYSREFTQAFSGQSLYSEGMGVEIGINI